MSGRRVKALLDAAVGAAAVALLGAVARTDRRRTANLAGAFMRKVGPFLPEHRLGRENLRAAYPEKFAAEIEQILAGVWDNLGRIAVEFAHLDEFRVESSGPVLGNSLTASPESIERAARIRASGKPVIAFAAHLANWEIAAVVAKSLGFHSAVLYRRPNIGAIGDVVTRLRQPLMGQLVSTGLDAPVKLARLLRSGVHVGVLADQHFTKGVDITFFGRPCKANQLIALLARQTGAAIHGMRAVRLPDGNSFWGEITDEIEPVRDADGGIDIVGTMQAINTVIEGWVREHPEQWLWLHRRWR
ncbi:MAG TPA: lipid A biosynthesis lauroyl acyltransferase [Xanthobacteraceae bacterium]|nr:lipid A biosynthesis lauroyl acyltransferase [Xanthobacteraceae bacterium]